MPSGEGDTVGFAKVAILFSKDDMKFRFLAACAFFETTSLVYELWLFATKKSVISEKVCKILLPPSPQAWGTLSLRGICDVSLSFYLIFHSRKYGSRLAYVPSVFSLATEPKR